MYSPGITFVGEEGLGNLLCRETWLARDKSFDRICHRDKIPTNIFPTQNRSVTNLRVSNQSALNLHEFV